MQKIYNLLGTLGFFMSGAMVVGGVMLYTSIPSITKRYINNIKAELTETILEQVPVPEMPKMPTLPTKTGPAIPLP